MKKYSIFFRHLKEVLDVLEPLFSVDCFLPRSFMAALSLTEVQEVIELDRVPMYVCIATMNYFLKSTVPSYRWNRGEPTLEEKVHFIITLLRHIHSLRYDIYPKNRDTLSTILVLKF